MPDLPRAIDGTGRPRGWVFVGRGGVLWAGVFVLALVAVAAYRTASPNKHAAVPLLLEPEPGCQLAQAACRAVGSGGALRVDVGRDARPLARFTVQARLDGIRVRDDASVRLEFSMPGMEMGPNRYQMQALGRDLWTADVILPLCTTRRIDWTLTVLIATVNGEVAAHFPLTL